MKDIVIIGGGPAGLTAAYELLKDGGSEVYNVTVLEESSILGGISRTVNSDGSRMDMGGHRFFSKSSRVTEWWNELMPVQGKPSFDDKLLGRSKPLAEGGGDPDKEDNVMLVRGRVSRIYYDRKFFDYPVKMNLNTIKGMGLTDTFRAGISYLKAQINKLPETNLENFYINRFGRVLYSMFFEGYTEKLWGRHPREISAEWGSQRVKGLSISALVKDMFGKFLGRKNSENTETSLIEEFYYPKYGPGQLWELAGEKVREMGGRIVFNSAVTKIETDGEKITSVTCSDGTVYKGDIFISSMPVKDLIADIAGADVPQEVKTAAEDLPYRDFMTAGLLVNKLKLKNKTNIPTLGNIVPDCWIYVQDKGVKMGRIQIFNNWSPYMTPDPQHSVWIGLEYFVEEGGKYWTMADKDFARFAANELRKMGVIGGRSVMKYHVERVKKAYPAYFDGYADFDKIRAYLDGFENLWCVGRNGQHRYNNMDHSMLTAMYTAEQIKNCSSDKTPVWNVNTETDYHESKRS